MSALILHPATERNLRLFIRNTPHSLLLIGPTGIGKTSIARYFTAELLAADIPKVLVHPYVKFVTPGNTRSISIDAVRELQGFLSLKVPGSSQRVARVAIIEDAHLLTAEAQNALLKTLEEPPLDTVIILTATSTEALLPTIQSRVQVLQLQPPPLDNLRAYLTRSGYSAEEVNKAVLISGGLPGLTNTIVSAEETHPLYAATEQARHVLRATTYERLRMVDGLSKQKELCLDVLFILGQMSRMALLKGAGAQRATEARWKQIMKASYRADNQLRHNANTKLVLTNLMLEL